MRRIVFLFLIIIIPIQIFPWTTPINISNTPICSYRDAITIGRDGKIHAVWTEKYGIDMDHDIYYAYSENNGDTWSTPENVCDDPQICAAPDVVVDSSNTVHLVWMNWSVGDIFWTYQLGDTWATPLDISNQSGSEEEPVAIVDKQGRIWAFWRVYGGDYQCYYTVYDGISWSTPQNLTNDTVSTRSPHVAIDSSGHLHVIWMRIPDGIHSYIHYSKYNGEYWTDVEDVPTLFGNMVYPKIGVDSDGRPWVIWREYTGPDFNRLYCSYRDSTGWLSPSLVADEDRFTHNFIIDSGDYIHLFWSGQFDTTDYSHLYYSFFDGISWSSPFDISDTSAQSAGWPDVVIDTNSRLHLIWSESLGNDKMEVLYSKESLTGVEEEKFEYPNKKQIWKSNFPNPFVSITKIEYRLIKSGSITITISNTLGQIIKKLELGNKLPGLHSITIPTELLIRKKVSSSGLYFYRIEADEEVIAKGKMVLLR